MMEWQARNQTHQVYGFFYDQRDELTEAAYGERPTSAGAYTKNNNYRTTYSYDPNGNIATLSRKGRIANGTFPLIDNLTYSYHPDGNKLKDVSDAALSGDRDFGYKYYLTTATGADYAYDANGNMTYDPCKALTVTFNHFNLPRRLDFGAGKIIEIVYDAAGAKLTKTVKQGTTTLLTQNYVAGIEYRGAALDAIYHAEGRLTPNGTAFFYEYTIRDHLGNSRISFRANGAAAQVIQVEPRPSAGAKSRTPYR